MYPDLVSKNLNLAIIASSHLLIVISEVALHFILQIVNRDSYAVFSQVALQFYLILKY